MESGPPTPDRPRDPESPGPDPGPRPPAPPPPGSPAPPPAPEAPAPGPQAPPPAEGPGSLPKAPPAPESPGSYGGPVPPGGWEQPIGHAPHAFAGAELSGWWRRVGAAILDGLILTIPVVLIVLLVVVVAAGSDVGAVVTGITASVAYFVAIIFYAPYLMKRPGPHNGQTWGKQAVGIRVVHDTGEEVTFGFAMLREVAVKYLLFNFVGGFFFSIPTLINYLWPLWDDQNRCLHDMIVKSHVVRT
jgi:uncharacterized RDD family membrane protein YckC